MNCLKHPKDANKCVSSIVFVVGFELTQYTYQMLKAGVDRRILRFLSDDNLHMDCNVQNGVHRMKIMEAAKSMYCFVFHAVILPEILTTCFKEASAN